MAKCTACDGKGGKTENTSAGGVTRKNWRSCKACSGTGQR